MTYPKEVGRNIHEILRAVRAIKLSDRYKVAMPANWPKNSIIGSSVIIPPPTNTVQIKEIEKKQHEGKI